MDMGARLSLHRLHIAAGLVMNVGARLSRFGRLVSTACHMVNHAVSVLVGTALVTEHLFPGLYIAAGGIMGMVTGLRIHRRHIAADIVVDMGTGIPNNSRTPPYALDDGRKGHPVP